MTLWRGSDLLAKLQLRLARRPKVACTADAEPEAGRAARVADLVHGHWRLLRV
ncbi:MAG: hypothetical protein OXC13_06270 [Caldilineaceae bacterium]|nr:hypothetical protein [Caldilineaceae bacterium]